MSRLRNLNLTCGWCRHPNERHDYENLGDAPLRVPCTDCPPLVEGGMGICDMGREPEGFDWLNARLEG